MAVPVSVNLCVHLGATFRSLCVKYFVSGLYVGGLGHNTLCRFVCCTGSFPERLRLRRGSGCSAGTRGFL